MKFDAVVGNPPYQIMDGGAQASSKPIYQFFIQNAKALNPNYTSFIIPTRWYAGGKGLDEFRDEMLNDTHLSILHDCLTPESIFPNTNIRGGVCYFLWDKNYDNSSDLIRVITHANNHIISDSMRPLKIDGLDIFIRNVESINIIHKVFDDPKTTSLMEHISSRKPFGFDGNFTKSPDFVSDSSQLVEPVVCYGKSKVTGYVERNKISHHPEWIDVWKVFTPYANNIGTELNDDNLNSFIGTPKSVCTETYIMIGMDLDLNKTECENICNYLKTKFARFMLSLAKTSQHATSKTYRFVPMQDFSKPWTDAELYQKYALTKEEIAFIESMIKPME